MKKLIFLMALALALALAGCGESSYSLTEAERQQTELGARDFAERAGGKFVSCSGQDSTSDGYVTCSTADASGTGKELLCGYKSRGCKSK